MAQFVAFDENVEISGRGLASIFDAISHMESEPVAITLFKEYNLYPIVKENWYAQQHCLDMMRELDAMGDLLAIGMTMIPDLRLYPKIATIPKALRLVNIRYQKSHRGGDAGDYRYIEEQEGKGRMICRSPYPAEFDFGILYGIIQHYISTNTMRILWDPKVPNRKDGADACEFIVKW